MDVFWKGVSVWVQTGHNTRIKLNYMIQYIAYCTQNKSPIHRNPRTSSQVISQAVAYIKGNLANPQEKFQPKESIKKQKRSCRRFGLILIPHNVDFSRFAENQKPAIFVSNDESFHNLQQFAKIFFKWDAIIKTSRVANCGYRVGYCCLLPRLKSLHISPSHIALNGPLQIRTMKNISPALIKENIFVDGLVNRCIFFWPVSSPRVTKINVGKLRWYIISQKRCHFCNFRVALPHRLVSGQV